MQSVENAHKLQSVIEEYLQKVTVDKLKPHRTPITLVEYNPHWPELIDQEVNQIRSILMNQSTPYSFDIVNEGIEHNKCRDQLE